MAAYIVSTNVVPYLNHHPLPLLPVSKIVTIVTDTYGRASAQVKHIFNVTLDTPKMEAVAIIHTNNTSLANLGFQAVLQLPGLEFSFDRSNVVPGPDKTVFTWDISILHFVPGPFQITADVIISLVSCGDCSTTTFKVPVELALTANE